MTRKPGVSLLVLLSCAMGIGPLINTGLSATSSLVITDLDISASQFGLLTTVCFSASAMASITLGRLSDRISGHAQLLIIFGGAALALLMAALAPDYAWLLAAVAVSGVSQAMSNPTTNRLVLLHVPQEKQPGWVGIKQAGLQASQLVAGLLFPIGAVLIGWQGAAAVAAVLALVLLVWAWNRLPGDVARASARVRKAGRRLKRPKTGAGSRSPNSGITPVRHGSRVWWYALQSCLASIGLTATNVYLPLYAHRGLGYSLVISGLCSAVIGLVGITSRIYWTRRIAAGSSTDALLLLLSGGSVVGAVLLLLAGGLQVGALLWAGAVVHAAMALGVNVVITAGLLQDVPGDRAGGATGIITLGMFFGIALGPLLMGMLLDSSGRFFEGWLLVIATNILGVLLAGFLYLRRKDRAKSVPRNAIADHASVSAAESDGPPPSRDLPEAT